MAEKEINWESRYATLAGVVPALEQKIIEHEKTIALLEKQKVQWELEKLQQQVIIQQSLNRSNGDVNKFLLENQKLSEENRELKAQLEKA